MHRPARLSLAVTLAALALSFALPRAAQAGGFEFGGAGTTGLGRSGAVAARADDGMALLYNPAMLADLPGSGDVMLNAGLAFWDACVSRSGTYGSLGDFSQRPTIFGNPTTMSDDEWIGDGYGSICNSGDPQFLPELVGTVRLSPEVRLGFGLIAPNGIGNARFGAANGTSRSADGSLAPAATRYMMLDRNLLQFFPSVGIGARITDWLRVGLTLQWGVAIVDFTNFTSTGISSLREDPSADIRTQLNVVDPFIPAGILSVHVVPHRNLDVMFSGRLSDSVGGVVPATGSLDLTTSAYGDPLQPGGIAPQTTHIPGTTLSAGSPFQFTVAARYADRIRPRAYEHGGLGDALIPQVDDPMWGENFDVELDVSYLHLSQVTDFVIRNAPGSAAILDGMPVPIPQQLPIVHGWSDAIAIRVGSDVNIVPGTFAVRAGFSWEQPLSYDFVRYMQNDFMQGFQIGLSAGATLRLDHFDISLAYSHTFGETIVATPANANFRNVAASGTTGVCPSNPAATPPVDGTAYDPSRPVSSRGCYPNGFGDVVNAGSYTQEFNAISLGLAYHFE